MSERPAQPVGQPKPIGMALGITMSTKTTRTSHLGPFPLRHLRFEIGRRAWAGGILLVTFGSSVHNPKIMLGMLVKVLGGDSIAARGCLARQGNVTFEDLMTAPRRTVCHQVAVHPRGGAARL